MNDLVSPWITRRTFAATGTVEDVARLKVSSGEAVTVCLPALDEDATIGGICRCIVEELIDVRNPVVDELIVIDSGSSDDTAAVARAAGASVIAAHEVLPELGPQRGKGEALWKSLAVANGDIVVWVDADLEEFLPDFVTSLVAPLLRDRDLQLVKAYYERPQSGAGGRVTELVARPLINLFWPELAGFIQPLSGEVAGRTSSLHRLPFYTSYAVDIGLLLDAVAAFGLDAVAQADLGRRVHRPRDLRDLGRMAFEIIHALIGRLDDEGRVKVEDDLPRRLMQFGPDGEAVWEAALGRRPPMREVLPAG